MGINPNQENRPRSRASAEDLDDTQIKRAIAAKQGGATQASIKSRFRCTWNAITVQAAQRGIKTGEEDG